MLFVALCKETALNVALPETYADFAAYLQSLGLFHMDMGLGRMRAALGALGLDRPGWVSAQVVGTNGKGSTSTFLATALSAGGTRTGLFTSPHFVDVRERALVDGGMLPRDAWLQAARAVLTACRDMGPGFVLTYFELVTVMAAWLFRRAGCGAVVFEAGLGGAHDATTALTHDLSVFTPIGLDHMVLLGPTPEDIARDKAGAMRSGAPAVTAEQTPAAARVLAAAAGELGVDLFAARDLAGRHGADWPTSPALPGPHQKENLRLALAAAWLLSGSRGVPAPPCAMRRAAGEAFLPGRMQWVSRGKGGPDCLLDGAHNQPGLAALGLALAEAGLRPRAMVFACLQDKDIEAMLPLARELCHGPIIVPQLAVGERAADAARLARALGPKAETARNTARALARLDEEPGMALVCGSLYLLAEVYALRPHWLRPAKGNGPAVRTGNRGAAANNGP